jgi:aspartate/methionine/tyrosine aminotransferase
MTGNFLPAVAGRCRQTGMSLRGRPANVSAMDRPTDTRRGPQSTTLSPEGSYTAWTRAAIAELIAGNGQVLSLFESSVPEPTHLLAKTLQQAFGHGFTERYTSAFVRGNPYVVRQLERRYQVGPESVLCTTGASSSLSLIFRAVLGPGDRVLMENPAFDLFTVLAESDHVAIDRFERCAPEFELDPDRVARAMHSRTRLIVFSNLHNPTGALADAAALREVGTIARRHGALVVVDEVYGDYAGPAFQAAATLGDEFISVSSLTKKYGLSTLRCGWAIAHPDVIAPVRNLYEESEFGVSKLAHSVAALVLEQPALYERYWQSMLAESRPLMQRFLKQWIAEDLAEGALPAYGCMYCPRLVGVADARVFSRQLARTHAVHVAPGEYFGAPGHVRIGFAQPVDRLQEALQRMTVALRARRQPPSTTQ